MSQENLSKPVESQEPVNIAQKLSENMDKALNAPKAVEKEVSLSEVLDQEGILWLFEGHNCSSSLSGRRVESTIVVI